MRTFFVCRLCVQNAISPGTTADRELLPVPVPSERRICRWAPTLAGCLGEKPSVFGEDKLVKEGDKYSVDYSRFEEVRATRHTAQKARSATQNASNALEYHSELG